MRLGLRGPGLVLAATSLVPVCAGQTASYPISPNLTSLPAGSHGASLRATIENLPPGTTFNVCFYTGFGDMTPIVPDSLLYVGNSASIAFQVDPSSIQYISATALSAVIPAKDFLKVHTIEVVVSDPSLGLKTTSLGISVTAPSATADFSGPTSIAPGSQITLNFKLSSAYPVDVLATFAVAFTPLTGLPDDPSVQFAGGGRIFAVDIPAGVTTLDPIDIQSGTVAGSLTVSTDLMAGGADITPASLRPLMIQAGLAAPGITSVNLASNGNTITVTVRGFSNTREISGAKFHFTPVAGKKIKTQDVAIDAQELYASWYSSETSFQYGSTCTYTQVFNLNSDANTVGQVSVVLMNTQGASPEVNSQ
jgi:hypothetical protein